MIVLDTHVWFWWLNAPSRLAPSAREAIEATEEIGVPSICSWELVLLEQRGRLRFDHGLYEWLRSALGRERIVSLALDPDIAVAAARLDPDRFPADPADRFIYATAVHHGARLVTADAAITAFDPARVVWS